MTESQNKKCIALYLDVDGVLNQYRECERMRRFKIGYEHTFNPFQKKVLRLAKLVKKYDIDVYVFSAWSFDDLQPHLPFKLKGDTHKWACTVNEIAEGYKYNLLIDDEVSGFIHKKGERYELDSKVDTYQNNYLFGLVLEDFKKIERILQSYTNATSN